METSNLEGPMDWTCRYQLPRWSKLDMGWMQLCFLGSEEWALHQLGGIWSLVEEMTPDSTWVLFVLDKEMNERIGWLDRDEQWMDDRKYIEWMIEGWLERETEISWGRRGETPFMVGWCCRVVLERTREIRWWWNNWVLGHYLFCFCDSCMFIFKIFFSLLRERRIWLKDED